MKMDRFVADGNGEDPNSKGNLIGTYDDVGDSPDIYFFEDGLGVGAAPDTFVPYKDIADIELDRGTSSRSVVIKTYIGKVDFVPILGGLGNIRDSMEVLHFLRRVVSDQKNV